MRPAGRLGRDGEPARAQAQAEPKPEAEAEAAEVSRGRDWGRAFGPPGKVCNGNAGQARER
jgi:hypothetical protein